MFQIYQQYMIEEIKISDIIISEYFKDFRNALCADVIVCGAGPAGMYSAYRLSRKNIKVVLVEKMLSLGGGIWGGGMLFNKIVVQEECLRILDELGISYKRCEDGYYVASAIELAGALVYNLCKSNVTILNGMTVEDVVIHNDRVQGVVVNWSAVNIARLHVDPLMLYSKVVIDSTGHHAEVVKHVARRYRGIEIVGEGAMHSVVGELEVVKNTDEVFPGLIVAGMAANALRGSPRMGPIFGGMLLSGEKAAEIAARIIKSQ